MSDITLTENEWSTNDLSIQKADEVSGRPSTTEWDSGNDRLLKKEEKSSDETVYQDLKLPSALQGCEENFASFKSLAAKLNLPTETVQKLVEWEAAIAASGQQKTESERAEILQKWEDQTKELFGPNYRREICRALEAADRFGGPELRELLEATGLGSHPTIVKTFQQISQQISEDESVSGRTRHQTDKTFAEALYGKVQ